MVSQKPDPGLRRDAIILGVAAAMLRAVSFGSVGLDHFDEGTYAMTAAAVASDDPSHAVYPGFHRFAPPLYPASIAGIMLLLGSTSAWIPILVSTLAGVVTVVLVYVLAHRWLGRAAAGAAAIAVLLSDTHILYSRAGLTDSLFLVMLLLALAAFAESQARASRGYAALAGLLTGLAWNTKYHGWLAGVIAAASLVPAYVGARPPERKALVGRMVLAGVIAAMVILPWMYYVEINEGYSRVMAVHGRHLSPSAFLQNALSQVRYQGYLQGWLSRAAPVAVVGWIAAMYPEARRLPTLAWAAALALTGALLGTAVLWGVLAVAGGWLLLRRRRGVWTPHWMVVCFFAVFTVLTPMYSPFPRLMLPWLIASTFLAAVALERLLVPPVPRQVGFAAPLVLAIVAGVLLTILGLPAASNPWRARNQLAHAAGAVDRVAARPQPIVVLGEPALVFYLRRLGRQAWHVNAPGGASEYVPAGTPYYLVGGLYSRRIGGPQSLRAWLDARPGIVLAGTTPVPDVSDVRLLDDFSAEGARRFRRERRSDYELRVYLLTATAP